MKRTLIRELKPEEQSKISGWALKIRDTKYMVFIVLQDRSGKIQVSIDKKNNEELVKKLEGVLASSILSFTGKMVLSEYVKDGGRVFRPTDVPSSFTIKPSIWAALYNTEFLKTNGIQFLETPGASYQDTAFSFKTLAMARRVRFLPDVLHNYRINDASSVSSPGKIFCVCDEEAEIQRFSKEKGIYEEMKGIMALRCFGSYKWNYNRLSSIKLRRSFMKRWSAEAKEMFRNGAITRKNFSKNRIFRLGIIAWCPVLYYFIPKV